MKAKQQDLIPPEHPSENECCAYAVEIGLTKDDGSAFWLHHEQRDWRIAIGKNLVPMKKWKLALQTWKKNAARFRPVAGNPMQRAKQMGIG